MNPMESAAWRVWHRRHPVRIPTLLMYGQDYLKKHGLPVSGDQGLDSERMAEFTVVNQPAAGIAILHAEGAPVDKRMFIHWEDCVKVYQDIQEHLRDWERHLHGFVHPDDIPPLEDFRKLEAVAVALYVSAKHYEPNEARGNALHDALLNLSRRRDPVRVSQRLRRKNTDAEGELKPYESIADRIETLVLGGPEWQ